MSRRGPDRSRSLATNQSRRVSVTGNIAGRDLGSVVKDVKARIAGVERQLPAGYFFEIGGSYSQMTEAFLILAGVFALALLLVYMVMASQFESFLHPFIIMFTIPLCLIGDRRRAAHRRPARSTCPSGSGSSSWPAWPSTTPSS